ncbi:MAG: TrkA family potassium uptake protein [Eubacteriales bacterium]|nr:TrkA family potassium uptake protein [Eubacteriales bacterium]
MDMKSFLIIGMGRFGGYLCRYLAERDCEIMIVDEDEAKVEELMHLATTARIADCRRRDVLETFDVAAYDACIVCIGEDFQSSLEITDLLRELGAQKVVSMASSESQARLLRRIGAHRIIFPEKDTAERMAVSIADDRIFEYFEMSGGCSMYEITAPRRWLGHTIVEINVRVHHGVNIAAVRRRNGEIDVPGADYVFCEDEHLWVIGKEEQVEKLLRHA